MEKNETNGVSCLISPSRISRIKAQGYDTGFTDEEISKHAIGNRFAYQLCTLLLASGLILANIPILIVACGVAFFSVILPYNVFDYLYNFTLRYWLKRPKLPQRPDQSKFVCSIATFGAAGIIYLFHNSVFVWGYILGGILFVVALLVSTTDICIASIIYNYLFRRGKQNTVMAKNNTNG